MATLTPIFCRGCGYDLRASEGRCPECGRAFDSSNPRTISRKPPRSAFFRWARRILIVLVVLTVAWGGGVLWLWHGWKAEQLKVAGTVWQVWETRPVYAWLPKVLPRRWEFVAERVTSFIANDPGDADLERLKGFARLDGLWISGGRVTDAGIVHLTSMTCLKWLDLEHTQVTDAALPHLKLVTTLVGLNLSYTRVTDGGLIHLKPMPGLKSLGLMNTQLTDAAVEPLAALSSLKWLDVRGTAMTAKGVRRLRQALPGTKVDADY